MRVEVGARRTKQRAHNHTHIATLTYVWNTRVPNTASCHIGACEPQHTHVSVLSLETGPDNTNNMLVLMLSVTIAPNMTQVQPATRID